MRKTLFVSVATAVALAASVPASAQERYNPNTPGLFAAGAVTGTVVGLGLHNGWFGSGKFVSSLPNSAAGSAVVGGVVGIGTVALLDAATQPCKGFRALFVPGQQSGCRNGEFVGAAPVRKGRYG